MTYTDTPDCPECAASEVNPLRGGYSSGCLNCKARHMAHGPEYGASAMVGRFVPAYRSLLQAVGGTEWEALHRIVKSWAQKIEQARAKG